MIRALVVDDEQLARERLTSFLRTIGDVAIIGEAKNGIEAVHLIEERAPDVVFLDVQMPGLDGFGVLQSLSKPPQIIFATAYDTYAIRAFEVHAADYLLKPITRARLEQAVQRVRDRFAARVTGPSLQRLVQLLSGRDQRYAAQLPGHKGKQIIVLEVASILWFAMEYGLVQAYADGGQYLMNFTLRQLEERLDPTVFFRAHKSRLVNLHKVKAIAPGDGGRFKLIMRDPEASEVELSRAQARILRGRMQW